MVQSTHTPCVVVQLGCLKADVAEMPNHDAKKNKNYSSACLGSARVKSAVHYQQYACRFPFQHIFVWRAVSQKPRQSERLELR